MAFFNALVIDSNTICPESNDEIKQYLLGVFSRAVEEIKELNPRSLDVLVINSNDLACCAMASHNFFERLLNDALEKGGRKEKVLLEPPYGSRSSSHLGYSDERTLPRRIGEMLGTDEPSVHYLDEVRVNDAFTLYILDR